MWKAWYQSAFLAFEATIVTKKKRGEHHYSDLLFCLCCEKNVTFGNSDLFCPNCGICWCYMLIHLNSISSISTHLETSCSFLIFVGCLFSPPKWCQQQGFYFPFFWWWPRWHAPWAFSTLELPSFRRWRLGRKMRDEDWREITDMTDYVL